MTSEAWRQVFGFEGLYEVSDQGRVRSVDRVDRLGRPRIGRVLAQRVDNTGYLRVQLHRDGVRVFRHVHRTVMEAFEGPRPTAHACHNDGDVTNNARANLRWDTPSGNMRDAVLHGTNRQTAKTHCPLGHSLTPPNLSASQPNGWRMCLACSRARAHLQKYPTADKKTVADRYYEQIKEQASWLKSSSKAS